MRKEIFTLLYLHIYFLNTRNSKPFVLSLNFSLDSAIQFFFLNQPIILYKINPELHRSITIFLLKSRFACACTCIYKQAFIILIFCSSVRESPWIIEEYYSFQRNCDFVFMFGASLCNKHCTKMSFSIVLVLLAAVSTC